MHVVDSSLGRVIGQITVPLKPQINHTGKIGAPLFLLCGGMYYQRKRNYDPLPQEKAQG